MLEDSNGNLWIATSHGLVIVEKNGQWQLLFEKDGLPSAFVSCLYQDSERNIWIGTALGLAKLVTKTSISVYTTDDGSISKVFSLLVPLAKDLFMTRTETGLHVFDSKKRLFSPVRSVHQFPYSDYIKIPGLFCFILTIKVLENLTLQSGL
ncbi:MAG: hypothetical protein IPP93_18635 [Chitinophagaceae bacterium]|nr:hypothetical protein [Chitinophagaceae bacterium]